MRTTFEQRAHDIQYRKRTGPTHDHTIETYTTGDHRAPNTLWDLAKGIVTTILVVVVIMLVMAISPD